MNYDIINKNLQKLDGAIKTFPNIIGKYQKVSTKISKGQNLPEILEESKKISAHAGKLGLSEYITFIDWINRQNGEIVSKSKISFDILKGKLIENAVDQEVKDFLQKKTKRGLITFFGSNLYVSYNNGSKGRRYNRKRYGNNFDKSQSLIANFVIQNEIVEISNPVYSSPFSTFYTKEIPNFEAELNTELDITNEITKSIIRKINNMKFDFRKLNFNLLKNEIETKIRERILSVESDEPIKCIEPQSGLTLNSLYNVNFYQIGYNGNLIVHVKNDNGINTAYSYRLFETISRLRESNIDDILNLIKDEG